MRKAQQAKQITSNKVRFEAEISPDVVITVGGRFLINNGLAEKWQKMRGKALAENLHIKAHGKITEDFEDHLLITQARVLGLIN